MTTSTRQRTAVPTKNLRLTVDPQAIVDAPLVEGVIGQTDAMETIRLGLELSGGDYAASHYNLVVVGEPNSGRGAKTFEFLRQLSEQVECQPPDVILIHNFDAPRRPLYVKVPGGSGREINKVLEFLANYATKIVAVKIKIMRRELLKFQATLIDSVKGPLADIGYLLQETEQGYALGPMSLVKPGEHMTEDERKALSEDVRQKIEGENHAIAKAIMDTVNQALVEKAMTATAEFREKKIVVPIGLKIAKLRKISEDPAFLAYLDQLEKLLLQFAEAAAQDQGDDGECECGQCGDDDEDDDDDGKAGAIKMLMTVAKVGILADNTDVKHPPVIPVPAPKFGGLFGKINIRQRGRDRIEVNHTMVEGGLLLKASGTKEHPGVLVIDFMDLLEGSGNWHSVAKLLRSIKTRMAHIESLYGFVLDETQVDYRCPEIPIHIRVVLLCTPYVNHVLRQNNPEFDNLFRIVAEFEDTTPVASAAACYRTFVERCRKSDLTLPEYAPAAIARLVEYGCRLADGQEEASTAYGILKDVITESAHWARKAEADKVGAEHVRKAIKERFRRSTLWVKQLWKRLDDGGKLLDHAGGVVGQVNGLVVYGGNLEFAVGAPSRVTVRAYAGESRVILVQREAETSGPYTNIATGVIRGYLSGQYGAKKPMGVTLSICFEQCGRLDGDSASLAETVACISAITELPVNQGFAITGSMNQMGMAQPIGGINQKVEGHFGTLKRRGLLDGSHGVIMPVQNLKDLMLDEEVVEAQRQGLYQVYAVTTLDEALELLLGRPAEEIHKLAQERLAKRGKGEKKSLISRIFRRK